MARLLGGANPKDAPSWTLLFGFREPPTERLDHVHHDGCVAILAEENAPDLLVVPGLRFEIFVGPVDAIARGEILEEHDLGLKVTDVNPTLASRLQSLPSVGRFTEFRH